MKLSAGVCNANANTHDDVRSLTLTEEKARSELGLRGDVLDGPGKRFLPCVDEDRRVGSDLNVFEVALRDEDVDVGVRSIGDRDSGRARRGELTRFHMNVEYGPRTACSYGVASEPFVF